MGCDEGEVPLSVAAMPLAAKVQGSHILPHLLLPLAPCYLLPAAFSPLLPPAPGPLPWTSPLAWKAFDADSERCTAVALITENQEAVSAATCA